MFNRHVHSVVFVVHWALSVLWVEVYLCGKPGYGWSGMLGIDNVGIYLLLFYININECTG